MGSTSVERNPFPTIQPPTISTGNVPRRSNKLFSQLPEKGKTISPKTILCFPRKLSRKLKY